MGVRFKPDHRAAGLSLVLGLAVVGCGFTQAMADTGPAAATDAPQPATLVADQAGVNTLTLTARAAERIGVRTVEVTAGTGTTTIIPAAAALYLPDGSTWTYVELESLTYRREPISIFDITPSGVVLDSGPLLGTFVVTSGVPEFWGLESGVGR
jgi:hypothetical protein